MINVNREKVQFEGTPEIIMSEIISLLKGVNRVIDNVIKIENRAEIFNICLEALLTGEIVEENE